MLDLYARRIVGWRVANTLRTYLALDALEHALWQRSHEKRELNGLVHHSDRGVQYLSMRYSERLTTAGVTASVGSKGDSFDNAAAESLNGLYKTELIRRQGPWRSLDDVELATLEWVDWYNNRRLHSACNDVPPAEQEQRHYRQITETTDAISAQPISTKPGAVQWGLGGPLCPASPARVEDRSGVGREARQRQEITRKRVSDLQLR